MMNTFKGIQVDKFTRLHLESPKLIRLNGFMRKYLFTREVENK